MGNNSTVVFIKYKDITIYGLVPITEPSKSYFKETILFQFLKRLNKIQNQIFLWVCCYSFTLLKMYMKQIAYAESTCHIYYNQNLQLNETLNQIQNKQQMQIINQQRLMCQRSFRYPFDQIKQKQIFSRRNCIRRYLL
ncbi:hypothetical protein pb186bvf_008164 [Paramecium bursaria]